MEHRALGRADPARGRFRAYLDFGVAKWIGARVTGETMETQIGMLLGHSCIETRLRGVRNHGEDDDS